MTEKLLRVDVYGVSVFVRGEDAHAHLTHVNQKLAVAKMALHRIIASFDGDGPFIAAKAIEDMQNA